MMIKAQRANISCTMPQDTEQWEKFPEYKPEPFPEFHWTKFPEYQLDTFTDIFNANPKSKIMQENELLYVDQYEIKQVKKQMAVGAKKLNEFYRLVLKTLGQFSFDDPDEFVSSSLKLFNKELKSRYQFPSADDDFNNKALGINPEPVYSLHANYGDSWRKFTFTFENGSFVPTDDQPLIEQCHYYADTPDRKKILKLARKVLAFHKEMSEANILIKPFQFWELFAPSMFDGEGGLSVRFVDILIQADNKRFNL